MNDQDTDQHGGSRESIFRIYHDDWEGVGFFDNECLYTVFQLNDKGKYPFRAKAAARVNFIRARHYPMT